MGAVLEGLKLNDYQKVDLWRK